MAATAEEIRTIAARDLSYTPATQEVRTYTLTGSPEHSAPWLGLVFERLTELLDLPENWDSYSGRAIDRRTALLAYQVLSEPMFAELPAPTIVPTSIGGVQAEWRIGSRTLEIEFVSDTEIELLSVDEAVEEEEECRLSFDLRPLLEAVARLAG